MKTIITSNDRSSLSFAELARYAGLFRYLSLRDVSIRYKQTWIGFGWSVIRPVINIAIFGTLRYLLDPGTGFADSFVQVSAGIVFWQLLSTVITETGNSLTANANILTKVYFPKIVLPLSAVLVCLVDYAIAMVLFLGLYLGLVGLPPLTVFYFPLVVLYGLIFAFSFGLLTAAASVKYRDVKFIVPFVLQVLFYGSPVFLSSEYILGLNLPGWASALYQANPLVFLLNAYKFCFFGVFEPLSATWILVGLLVTLLLMFFSLRYFTKFEQTFADYI